MEPGIPAENITGKAIPAVRTGMGAPEAAEAATEQAGKRYEGKPETRVESAKGRMTGKEV